MTTFPTETGAREFSFTDEDFRSLASLARSEFGLSLAESKKPLVYSRLARRLRSRQLSRFQDYMSLLKAPGEEDERLELISALTTNVTSFFREKHHFETLKQQLVPELRDQKRIRLWSAGCSSGQEPYSLAMTLMAELPDNAVRNLRILATDIDPVIVRKARTATYPQEDLQSIPPQLRERFTTKTTVQDGQFEIALEARELITFGELNLMETWPFQGPFDAILCRNVAIYFDQDTQQVLWQRFADKLRVGGYLFIGHSERVSGPALELLSTAGVTTYRRIKGPEAALAN
ncbi:chemotaxis protein methyltransferase [Salipiger pallidus]|uniref:Chemotaxis protein methyltransferase n=1 Tax=Salipiger pallidus TaxID=1775170 RepID=A0A8J3EED2_9RHOB|nr:protein-glutamate O-methyltransferase CheR [Salipiger pallidus]GGG63363.1 chemotaxis protein methyltransferase [Salipiger pallidus]